VPVTSTQSLGDGGFSLGRSIVEGDRHQRFILRLSSGQTLLIVHNLDLAPRAPVERGSRATVRGEYEWNEQGGVIHWTHHDPDGRRPGGWIRVGKRVVR